MTDQPRKEPLDEMLLDLHLDRLDPDERAALERRLTTDADLAARNEALGRVLRPLDSLVAPSAPANLADKVIRHVADAGLFPTAEAVGHPSGGWRFSLRDLMAVAACLGLLFVLVVPGMAKLREHAQRTVCADNFGSIYRAVTVYGQTFMGELPNAGSIAGGSWLYSGPADAPRASNSRHPYLLARLGFIADATVFLCPSSPDAPVPVDDLTALDDFASPANCTYDTLNMAGPTPTLSGNVSAVYASDPNPLFINGFYHASVNPNTTNSPQHGGKGQNVLSLDGQTRWMTSPFHDRRDNIWMAGDLQAYTGTETQVDADDTFLIPATPDVQRRFPTR